MIRPRHLTGLLLTVTVAACARNEEAGRASVDAVTDSPNDYIGRTITVRGEVDELQDDRRVFTVEDHDWIFPEKLLVVRPGPTDMAGQGQDQLREDQSVMVTGTVQRLLVTDLEREYDLDLERDFELEFRDRPILVAASIQPMAGGEEATNRTGHAGETSDQAGATVPPPADSALLERDLPQTPVGDTLRDMNSADQTGAVVAAGAPVTDVLLIVPVPGPQDLIGRPVQLTDVPLRSQAGDRGYWVGPSHSEQVFVRLKDEATASNLDMQDRVTVWGTAERVPGPDVLVDQWGLDSMAAGILTRNEALYVKADSVRSSTQN